MYYTKSVYQMFFIEVSEEVFYENSNEEKKNLYFLVRFPSCVFPVGVQPECRNRNKFCRRIENHR